MRELISIDLLMDTCVSSKKKRMEILRRLKNNLHITGLELFFDKKNISFSIYLEEGKIYFDRSSFISTLCSVFSIENVQDIDEMLKKVKISNVEQIKDILPDALEKSIKEEVDDVKRIKETLNSMTIAIPSIKNPIEVVYSSKANNDFKMTMNRELDKVEKEYNRIFDSMRKHNEFIQKQKEQMNTFFDTRIKTRLLHTYENLKKEMYIAPIIELTDAFVLENIDFEKLLYISLVVAYQKKHQEYIEENIGKLTKRKISEYTEKITEKYHGKNKEFLKTMKEFALTYGKSSLQREDLIIEGADIHLFSYNFLSVENKKDIGRTIADVEATVIKQYNKTQRESYLLLLDKLQVLKELDVKELFIGQNSFEGYIGYKEENSNIMLDKYFEDRACTIPSVNHACYIVDEKDFGVMATNSKEVVMQMIKDKVIHAKRIYHDHPTEKKNGNKKYFKEKVLGTMRSPL